MAFGRGDLRDILGEAYTDDIAKKLIEKHREVVDRINDDLDSEKKNSEKYKAEAEKYKKESDKLQGVQKELDDFKKEDWKAKYEQEHTDYEGYKTQVAKDAETAKIKAAYKKLLTDEKISEKALESVLNATDYSKMKLKEDGSLDGVDDLKKDIDTRWGGFRVSTRQRGQRVENPPQGNDNGGGDNSIRARMAAKHAAQFGAQTPQNNN